MEDDYDHAIQLCELNRFDEARPLLNRLIEKYPDDPIPVFLLANIHIVEDDPHTARQLIEQAMITTPDVRARDLVSASRLFFLLGDITQAISHGRRAIEIDPDSWIAHDVLADAYAADPTRNLMLEAEYHAAKAAELAPEEPEIEPAPEQRKTRRFSPTSISLWVTVGSFTLGPPVLKWLSRTINDLLGIDRAQDEYSLVGFLVIIVLAIAAWGIYRAVGVRRRGDRIAINIRRRRALSRELHATLPGKRAASATNLAGVLCFLPLPVTGWLAAFPLDDHVPPTPGATAISAGIAAALSLLFWSFLRWWFGPGQLLPFFASSLTLCIYLLITGALMLTSIALAIAQVTNEPTWLTLLILHFAWLPAVFVPILKVSDMGRKPL